MKTPVFVILKFICYVALAASVSSCINVSSQSSEMREVENKSPTVNQAPPECLTVFREFLAYARKTEPSIVTDKQAQNRWLSQQMRKSLVERNKRPVKSDEKPDALNNETFVGVWNKPAIFSVVGSRHYDFRNKENPNDNRAIIDVLYEWDKNKNPENQYPGEKSLYSYIFVYEEGAWKLDDIYTYDDVYAGSGSLRQYLEKQ